MAFRRLSPSGVKPRGGETGAGRAASKGGTQDPDAGTEKSKGAQRPAAAAMPNSACRRLARWIAVIEARQPRQQGHKIMTRIFTPGSCGAPTVAPALVLRVPGIDADNRQSNLVQLGRKR